MCSSVSLHYHTPNAHSIYCVRVYCTNFPLSCLTFHIMCRNTFGYFAPFSFRGCSVHFLHILFSFDSFLFYSDVVFVLCILCIHKVIELSFHGSFDRRRRRHPRRCRPLPSSSIHITMLNIVGFRCV